ncbi:patatin-like phospholipase family protein [Kordia zhangzhouensis]|uniref:patatin-like phospholipase family protein n=1 Tax=Kordia zhangzhouensis TaxID=1620405 RepID=UPI00062901BD|nr:patatin-like phospholipase family protein [Kordia zhangzhouensis]
MAFNIEILATNENLYSDIEQAITTLNQVQSDFIFQITSSTYQDFLFLHKAGDYKSEDVFSWIIDFKEKAKGHRPFVIVVVDGFLQSKRLSNIFGTVSAKNGFAVFTTHDFEHFVYDRIRYLRYYFVRYALSFLEPSIKSHNDPNRKTCIFHKKMNKLEIRDSLNSGEICSECFNQLKPKLTLEIKNSINSLLQIVSNQFPYSLVVKGGGVKGLAFAGALLELEKHFSFDTFAGTSAGAIASVLLGAGYKPNELIEILSNKNFSDFKDAKGLKIILNFIITKGLYPGNEIEKWINELLKSKYPNKLSKVKLKELEHQTIVYSSRIKDGTLTFDSKGERMDNHAAFAARCSMSIPYYFSPKYVDGIRVYDGGLRSNFPLKTFTERYPNKPFIGMFLVSDSKEGGLVIGELMNIAIEGEEIQTVEKYINQVVVIDSRPIKTTDFNLTEAKKDYLICAGRIGALKYILRAHPDIRINEDELNSLELRIKELQKEL